MRGTFIPLLAGALAYAAAAAFWFAYYYRTVAEHSISSILQPIGELLLIPMVASTTVAVAVARGTRIAKYGRIIAGNIANALISLLPTLIITSNVLSYDAPVSGLVLLGLPTIVAGIILWCFVLAYAWLEAPAGKQ
jgi:hypothetical protein